MRAATFALAAPLYLAGCSSGNQAGGRGKVPLAVVVAGAPAARAAIERALAERPIEGAAVRVVSPPASSVLATLPSVETNIGEVRKKYLAADVDGCLALLGGDGRIEKLLAAEDRSGAARALFWRVACRVAGDQRARAESDAVTFAALDLAMPADARDASPEVENLIDRAIQRAANEPAWELSVSSNVGRTTVRLDGSAEGCLAPCTMKARHGAHVVTATADGALPATVRATLDAPRKSVQVVLASAPLDVAASQWRSRYETTSGEQSLESARLLAVAVPARYLVLLTPEQDAARARLRGLLFYDADVRARAENVAPRPSPQAPAAVIDELLHQSKLVEHTPLYKSPWFWIAAVATAAGASTITYFALKPAEERTDVRIR